MANRGNPPRVSRKANPQQLNREGEEVALSPLTVIDAARKAVPAVNYALGVAGLAATASIVEFFVGKERESIIILGGIFVAMILLYIFGVLVSVSKQRFFIYAASILLLYVVLLFFFIFLGFTVSAVAEGWPPAWAHVLGLETTLSQSTQIRSPISFPSPTPEPSAIFMECQFFWLPIKIPPQSTLHLIALNKKRMQSAPKWGFLDVPNTTDKEESWPPRQTVKLSKRKYNFRVFGYKCDVSNHGPDNILYLGIPIDVSFDNEKPPIRYEALVSSLDVGKSFSFYLLNDCPVSVTAIWQDTAKVQTLQNSATHDVPLRRTYQNPIDQIMMFFPSPIQWSGQPLCG
jgi:uncharacterized MAPEG superfamily protein